ncbi:hypothetical protein GCM10010464_66020 [Pseudonocardia yunnanensis]
MFWITLGKVSRSSAVAEPDDLLCFVTPGDVPSCRPSAEPADRPDPSSSIGYAPNACFCGSVSGLNRGGDRRCDRQESVEAGRIFSGEDERRPLSWNSPSAVISNCGSAACNGIAR